MKPFRHLLRIVWEKSLGRAVAVLHEQEAARQKNALETLCINADKILKLLDDLNIGVEAGLDIGLHHAKPTERCFLAAHDDVIAGRTLGVPLHGKGYSEVAALSDLACFLEKPLTLGQVNVLLIPQKLLQHDYNGMPATQYYRVEKLDPEDPLGANHNIIGYLKTDGVKREFHPTTPLPPTPQGDDFQSLIDQLCFDNE